MKQIGKKIINIEHADNVHVSPDLSGATEKLNQVIESIPGLIESTIMMLSSKNASRIPVSEKSPVVPASLQNICKDTIGIGDIVMSHWQIDRCIGKGSISTVYEAHHTADSLYKSAIKVVHSSFEYFDITNTDATHEVYDASSMIQMELGNMVELKGTGYIVEYEDHEAVENADGSQDIIIRMELLHPLPEVLRSKMLPRDEVVKLGIDICKALKYCEKDGIIHGDVKPSNIYVTKWGGYKLGDFSASLKTKDSRNSNRIGTLKYMAPEVYNGKPFTGNIDTYSLGLILYELMKSAETDLSERLSGAPLPLIPGIDKCLQSIISKACSYDPSKRFSSATEMLDKLLKAQ